MDSSKHILVTGGAGYIGSHMTLALLAAGEQPIIIDNLSSGLRSAIPVGAPFFEGDVGDAALLDQIFRRYCINAILHFAASVIVPESIAQPLGYYENNTMKSRQLIEAAVRHSIPHFVFSSTAAVYGEAGVTGKVTEDDCTNPINPYGRSKLMVEWMLADVARSYPLSHVALRYFNVAGADPHGRAGQSTSRATHLIKVAVQAALGGRKGIEVFGTDYPTADGSCIRDYVHVSDLAQAHLDALAYLRSGGKSLTCNVGYATGYSVLEVIDTVKRVAGSDFPVTLSGRRAGDPARLVASNERAKTTLGWLPQHNDLATIVTHALAWEQHLNR